MRRLIAATLILFALLIAGCGGDDSSGSPLDSALSYLPKDAPFAAAIDTEVDGDQYQALQALIKKFPFGEQLQNSLQQQLEQSSNGINFNDDVKPALGNPFVVGAPDSASFNSDSGSSSFVAAIKTKDGDSLDNLIEKTKSKKTGEESGATLYESDGSVFAVEGDTLIFAGTREQLTQALARADGDDHLDEDTFNEGLDGLPDSALARVHADLEALLKNDPGSADARMIKWVGALRTLGATLVATDGGIDVDFRVRTEGDLSDEDLPIAPGDDSPDVIKRRGEIGLGIRDLAHIVRFAENAGQTVDPAGFGDYAQAKKTIDKQLGVSLDDDLIGQLTGDVSATVSIDGKFGVRAQLKDPQAFERTLTKVADVLPSFAAGAGLGKVHLSKPRGNSRFYALTRPGAGAVVFGVVDDVLVVASNHARANELATEEPTSVPDAKGSVALSADAEQLVNTLLGQLGPALGMGDFGGLGAALLTRPLGDLNGWMSASTDELRGKLTLAID